MLWRGEPSCWGLAPLLNDTISCLAGECSAEGAAGSGSATWAVQTSAKPRAVPTVSGAAPRRWRLKREAAGHRTPRTQLAKHPPCGRRRRFVLVQRSTRCSRIPVTCAFCLACNDPKRFIRPISGLPPAQKPAFTDPDSSGRPVSARWHRHWVLGVAGVHARALSVRNAGGAQSGSLPSRRPPQQAARLEQAPCRRSHG